MQGMETGPGLTRALTAVLENGVDVINMSYGEATTTPNAGRFIELSKVRSSLLHAVPPTTVQGWAIVIVFLETVHENR